MKKTIAWLSFFFTTMASAAIPFGGGKDDYALMALVYGTLFIIVVSLSTPVVWFARHMLRLKREGKGQRTYLASGIFLTITSVLLSLAAVQIGYRDTGPQLILVAFFPFVGFLISLWKLPPLPPYSIWKKGRWLVLLVALFIPSIVFISTHELDSFAPTEFVSDGMDLIKRIAFRPFCPNPPAKELALRWVADEKISPWRRETRWPYVLNAFRVVGKGLEIEVNAYGCDNHEVTLSVQYFESGDGRTNLIEALRAIGDVALADAISNARPSLPLDVQVEGRHFHAEINKNFGNPESKTVWISEGAKN